MKLKIIGLMICLGFLTSANAQVFEEREEARLKTVTFSLEGEKAQCGSLGDVLKPGEGIVSADYNWLTRDLEVAFDPNETDIDEIKDKLEGAGYVTHLGETDTDIVEDMQMGEETPQREIALDCKYKEEGERY